MNLRSLPDGLNPAERITERRKRIEEELSLDLSSLETHANPGQADEKNCEQMFGHVQVPVGYAGPLPIEYENKQKTIVHLPLATTEGALVASVNRGCKAIAKSAVGNVQTSSVYHGMTRSLAFKMDPEGVQSFLGFLESKKEEFYAVAEATSGHLKVLSHDVDTKENHVFLTLHCNTDEAMGMNMTTIAAQAVGDWLQESFQEYNLQFVTVAGNVDSDKKPSQRTHDQGRGYEVCASLLLDTETIQNVLKTTPEAMLAVAEAKLTHGSEVAGALGHNLHAANIITALYLATGQDAAHVVEGSLADTCIKSAENGLKISVRLPAVLVGIRGGGTALPSQNTCLNLLLKEKTDLHPCTQLAETIGAAVLAGELSLLAAQSSHTLTKAHSKLGR